MQNKLSDTLNAAVSAVIPGATLGWRALAGTAGLRGFFLEEEAALRPLPAGSVEAVMESPPYWGLLWPSGERLCRLMHRSARLLSGKTVLDFGAGCGLVAVAAKAAGAERVYAVDCEPLALCAIRLNALENGVEIETGDQAPDGEIDVLLLADFLYDRSHLPLFEQLQAQAREVVVVDSRLCDLDVDGFSYLGEASGTAVPDLDPHREFGRLRFWYRGERLACWQEALLGLSAVAQGVREC